MNPNADETALDQGLLRLEAYGSELANGFTNHAPMVADAMVALGFPDALQPWLDRYLRNARGENAPGRAVDDGAWRDALGQPQREADWHARFAADITVYGWTATLQRWVPRLADGFAAAAAHGVIRTGHAARALAARETTPRLHELARALASWACAYQTLPGDPLHANGSLTPAAALSRVPLVDTARRRNDGAITRALRVLANEPDFAAAVTRLDRDRPLPGLTLDIATAFAGMFRTHVRQTLDAIVFTHAITGVAAARRLAHCVDAETARRLTIYAWQLGCALYAVYGYTTAAAAEIQPVDSTALARTAITHGDEHVIKLTEACLEFHAATGDGVFLDVCALALERIPGWGTDAA